MNQPIIDLRCDSALVGTGDKRVYNWLPTMRLAVKYSLLAVLAVSAFAQQTPNLHLNLRSKGTPNWDVLLNQNFTTLDSALSGGDSLTGINIAVKNLNGTKFADQFPGTDMGAQINAAYADLPATGGTIYLAGAASCYRVSTPIVFNVGTKLVKLKGLGNTAACLQFTASSGTLLTVDTGTITDSSVSSVEDLRLYTTVAGSTATGLAIGPTNGCKFCYIHNVDIAGFKLGITSASLFNIFDQTVVNSCSSATANTAYTFSAPGDDDKWYGGTLAGCATLIDLSAGTNGPLTLYGTLLLGGNGNPPSQQTTKWINNNETIVNCFGCHLVNPPGSTANFDLFDMPNCCAVMNFIQPVFESDRTTGTPTSWATVAAGQLNITQASVLSAGETATELIQFTSGSGNFTDNTVYNPVQVSGLWNASYSGVVTETGTILKGASTPPDTLAGRNLIIGAATPTGSGTRLGLGTTVGFGNGSAGAAVTTTTKNTGTGPTTPQTVVNYLEIDIGGTKYWIPLVQ